MRKGRFTLLHAKGKLYGQLVFKGLLLFCIITCGLGSSMSVRAQSRFAVTDTPQITAGQSSLNAPFSIGYLASNGELGSEGGGPEKLRAASTKKSSLTFLCSGITSTLQM